MEPRLQESVKPPLVPEVEGLFPAGQREHFERYLREERILQQLRQILRRNNSPPVAEPEAPDRYEPQRLTRKICWQYDVNARRIPLLRRPYI